MGVAVVIDLVFYLMKFTVTVGLWVRQWTPIDGMWEAFNTLQGFMILGVVVFLGWHVCWAQDIWSKKEVEPQQTWASSFFIGIILDIVCFVLIGVPLFIILRMDVNQGIKDCSTDSISGQMPLENNRSDLEAIKAILKQKLSELEDIKSQCLEN